MATLVSHETWDELSRKQARCCFADGDAGACSAVAEYAVHEQCTHPAEVTEACAEHLGFLLGEPPNVPPDYQPHWSVWPVDFSAWPYAKSA